MGWRQCCCKVRVCLEHWMLQRECLLFQGACSTGTAMWVLRLIFVFHSE